MRDKPFYVGVGGMPPTRAAHLVVAFGATVKSRFNHLNGII